MKFLELLEEGVTVLRTNRLRTGLSALGIIIGIGSVITLMTLGQASKLSVTQRIQSLGANLLTIYPESRDSGFIRNSSGSSTTLSNDDATALATSQRITSISQVAPVYEDNAQLSYKANNDNVSVSGVTEEFFELRNIKLAQGRLLTEEDNTSQRKLAVVNENLVTEVMDGTANPVGETIRLNGTNFVIVGVTQTSTSFGRTRNEVYIPLLTAQKALFGVNHLSTIYVQAKDEQNMEPAQNQVGFLLLEMHGLKNPDDADFSISSQEDLLETVSEVTKTFTTLLTGIAAISLIVGGIGIMNIMLVTVTERTREIGIRKALGAKRKEIISQFLLESVMLTIVGGFMGVALGITLSLFLTDKFALPRTISYESIGLAVIVSCVIGIIFGIYPAYKASKLQPIEALRYE